MTWFQRGRLAVAAVMIAAMLSVHAEGPNSTAADTAPTFSQQELPSFLTTGVSRDFEPAIRVGPDGTVYVASNYHLAGTSTRGVELWSAPFGSPLASDGQIPPAVGGLDVDLAVGSTGNLYDGTLFSQTPMAAVGSLGIGAGVCPAGSIPGAMNACVGTQKVNNTHTDRPWVAADGPSTVYVSFAGGSKASLIEVDRSTDGGMTWQKMGDAISPSLRSQATDNNLHGPIVVDPATHTVYQVFTAGEPGGASHQQNNKYFFAPENYVYMGVSHDGGATFTDSLVYHAPTGTALDSFWPMATVDAAGNVYAAWSDTHDVYVAVSTDEGQTWSSPIKISQDGPGLNSSVEPWITGGHAGNLAVVWYGSSATDNLAPDATWNVYYAQVRGLTGSTPSISQQVVTTHSILNGPLCAMGEGCSVIGVTRYVYEDFGVALDPRTGLSAIAYMDCTFDPNNPYRIAVAQQTGGPSL
jgi:hypothetical protein